MSKEEEENFTFMWRVRNFSMCPVQFKKYISSPVFRISKFKNSEWELCLYPKGHSTKDFISCFLYCKSLGTNNSNISIQLSLCLSSFEKNAQNAFVALNENWGFPDFVSLNDILNDKAKHLPNDTLTIKCTMKCRNLMNLDTTEENIAETKSRECICKQNYMYSSQCCIETLIHVETKSVIWTIQRFLYLPCTKALVLTAFSPVTKKLSLYVTLYKIAESPTRIEIKRKKNCISDNLYIRCRLSVINTENEVKYCAEDTFLFQSEEDVWTFPPFLKLSDLEKDGYLESTDGKLHLQFDFTYSVEGQMHHYEQEVWNPVLLTTQSQLPVKLFTESDDDQSVVTLKAGDRTFKVHRSILESKSEVLHRMFESDMKEGQSGIADITDVDPNIVAQMLEFLYFNTVAADLSLKDVTKLYALGQKYQIKCLVSHCSPILVSLLSVSSVCDILDLVDLYQDQQLLNYAQEFVTIHSDCILVSEEWQEFMERSGTLAAKVLHKILIK